MFGHVPLPFCEYIALGQGLMNELQYAYQHSWPLLVHFVDG